jgi:hypothetical protein
MAEINQEFVAELKKAIDGEIKTDPITRALFSTDASIHKIVPYPHHSTWIWFGPGRPGHRERVDCGLLTVYQSLDQNKQGRKIRCR